MRLIELVALYTKARVYSWLTNSSAGVYIPTPTGKGTVAYFCNGRFVDPDDVVAIPNTVPPEWMQPQPPEQPEEPEDGDGEKE